MEDNFYNFHHIVLKIRCDIQGMMVYSVHHPRLWSMDHLICCPQCDNIELLNQPVQFVDVTTANAIFMIHTTTIEIIFIVLMWFV